MGIFYTDQDVFGFDIGRSSIKIMQISPPRSSKSKGVIKAYGNASFDPKAISKGVIVEPEIIIKAAYNLISTSLIGKLTTKHAAVSLPNSHSFTRIISVPADIKASELDLAAQAEITESIPLPLADLYYDFTKTKLLEDGNQEVQIVASPSRIVESFTDVVHALGLTPAVIEPNINSVTRMVVQSEEQDAVSLIIDLGSEASDLSAYDGTVVSATGTVECGGENLTRAIAKELGLSLQQAYSIKTRYGLDVSKKQSEVVKAVEPELNKLILEIKKVMRYYAERSAGDEQIGQIILLGGGANLPGLSSYITDKARIPTRLNSPWNNLSFDKLQPPHELETTIYTTAAGLSLIRAEEISQ